MTDRAKISYHDGKIIAEPVMGSTPELAKRFNLRDLGGFPTSDGRRPATASSCAAACSGRWTTGQGLLQWPGPALRATCAQARGGQAPDDIVPAGATYLQGAA